MKAIKCEVCEGTSFAKEDGAFVCQNCRTRYSVEEAKKLMVEISNEKQETINENNSLKIEKYLTNARRAKEVEDWNEVEKYYNLIEQDFPSNLEAIFYSAYAKAKNSLVEVDIYKRESIFKVLENCITLVEKNYDKEKEEHINLLEQITIDIIKIVSGKYVYNYTKNGNGEIIKSDKSQTEELFLSLVNKYLDALYNITELYGINEFSKTENIHLMRITLYEYKRDYMNLTLDSMDACNKRIVEIHKSIKGFKPEHNVPIFESYVALKRKEQMQQAELKKKEDIQLVYITLVILGAVILFAIILGPIIFY